MLCSCVGTPFLFLYLSVCYTACMCITRPLGVTVPPDDHLEIVFNNVTVCSSALICGKSSISVLSILSHYRLPRISISWKLCFPEQSHSHLRPLNITTLICAVWTILALIKRHYNSAAKQDDFNLDLSFTLSLLKFQVLAKK